MAIIISPPEGGYIGLVGLLGVSLQLTLPSSCSVRYPQPQFGYNSKKCETPSNMSNTLFLHSRNMRNSSVATESDFFLKNVSSLFSLTRLTLGLSASPELFVFIFSRISFLRFMI